MEKGIPIYDIAAFEEYKNTGILVSRFGPYSRQHAHLHSAHRHSFYHLVYFTEGKGSQTIDFKNYPVQPGLIYFMTPGQVHSWSFEGAVDGYIINFSEDYFHSFLFNPLYLENFGFFDGLSEAVVLLLPDPTRDKVSTLFEEILLEGKNAAAFNADLVRILILQIFIQVARTSSLEQQALKGSYNQTLLRNFKKLIEENFVQLRFPKQYAEILYITPNHLNALCNDLLGISAGQLIRDRVVLEAKRLLINMEFSVAEISVRLAFSDPSYFIKFFKKYAGVTPDRFRKQNNSHTTT